MPAVTMPVSRVIVTRPEPEAERWVQLLHAHGLRAQALPLIETSTLSTNAVQVARQDILQTHASMFVSPAAVHAFFAAPVALNGQCRFLATGPGTVRALQAHGVPLDRIDAPASHAQQFDSEALWQVIGGQDWTNKRVMIVRGRDASEPASTGRDWLAQRLVAAQAHVHEVIAYERRQPHWTTQQQQVGLNLLEPGSIWLFSSSQAVNNLSQLMPGQDFSKLSCIATHERIAQACRRAGWGNVHPCKPDVQAIVALCHAQ